MYSLIHSNLSVAVINKCLRRLILRIWWPENVSNEVLWDRTNQEPTEHERQEWEGQETRPTLHQGGKRVKLSTLFDLLSVHPLISIHPLFKSAGSIIIVI